MSKAIPQPNQQEGEVVANVTSRPAIKFCDERVRPLADAIARMNMSIQLLLGEWVAKGMHEMIPDDVNVVVEDGAPNDGRTAITGHDVREIIALAIDLTSMATGPASKIPSVLKVAVNPG